MKKVMIVAIAICTASFASCQSSKSPKNFSTIDSLSYAAGVQFGTNFSTQDPVLNGDVFGSAVSDAFAEKGLMTIEEANAFVQEWFTVRKPALDRLENQMQLDEVRANNPNVSTSESGLVYEIIAEGDPNVKAVNNNDRVATKYRGTILKDGSEFDSNDSLVISLNSVIPGWKEGMKLIGKGGEIVLWVPSELGYGPQARPGIPANSVLKFEIELLDVIPTTPAN